MIHGILPISTIYNRTGGTRRFRDFSVYNGGKAGYLFHAEAEVLIIRKLNLSFRYTDIFFE